MANFEIKHVFTTHKTKWGEVRRQHGLSQVWFNGHQCGLVPCDKDDKNYRILHPLAGFPEDLTPQVVAASNGRITGSLKCPADPSKELSKEETNDDDDNMGTDQE